MISFSKILVGVDLSHADRLISEDLSAQCEQAVKDAILLAQGGGGTLTFMAVLDISEQAMHLIEVEEGEKKSKIEQDAERVLGMLVERAEQAGVQADFRVAFGPSAINLIRTVLQDEYSLVVVGRKRRVDLSHFFFGRTVVKLLRKCPVPVFVAKPNPDRPFENILAADDLSEIGEDVLDSAVQTARMFESHLHVVHVIESGDDEKLASADVDQDRLQEMKESRAERAKSAVTDRLSQTDYRTLEKGTMIHVEAGRAEQVIAGMLEEHVIDLLVMGTVGRSGISAVLMGNTAERLLAQMDCSLLAIKPPDFQCPIRL